jgi:hypothetical protein
MSDPGFIDICLMRACYAPDSGRHFGILLFDFKAGPVFSPVIYRGAAKETKQAQGSTAPGCCKILYFTMRS